MKSKAKLIVYLIFLVLSLLSASAGNVSINYGWNGSAYIPFKLTSDGRLMTDINKVNLTAGALTVSNNIASSGNISLGDKIVFGLGEVIDNIVDGMIRVTGNLNVTGNAYLNSMVFEGGNLTAELGKFTTLNVTGTSYLGSMTLEGGNITASLGTFATLNVTGAAYLGNVTIESGNITPVANNTYSLGSPTLWWKDLYLANDSLYIAGTALSATAEGVLQWNGTAISNVAVQTGNNTVLGTAVNENVGIGTSSPTSKLDVAGTVNATQFTINGSDLYFVFAELSDKLGNTTAEIWGVIDNETFARLIGFSGENITSGSVADTYVTDDLTIASTKTINTTGGLNVSGGAYISGNVGVGINNPSEKLNVSGDIGISENVIASGNVTLGQKITFAFGEIIDNIVDGIIKINGNLNVSGSVTADSVTETNGVLKQNLLTNSGFGVWSNSEDLYDPANGAVPVIGNSLFANADFEGGDVSWTKGTGWTIAGGVGVATAVNNDASIRQVLAPTAGKLYEITYTISGYSSGSFSSYIAGAVSGPDTVYGTTYSADGTYSDVFESDGSSNNYGVISRTSTSTFNVDNVILTEVTPGIVGASTTAFDGWAKIAAADIWREQWDGTAGHFGDSYNVQTGSIYSLKITAGTANNYVHSPSIANRVLANHLAKFAGRTVTLGAWVKTDTASHARVYIEYTGGAFVASPYHTGDSTWQWLEATLAVPTSVALFDVFLRAEVSGETAYYSQPMLVFGNSIGEGNYMQPFGEVVWLEKYVIPTDYNEVSVSAATRTINLEAQTNGKIPKGCKAVYIWCYGTNAAAGQVFYFDGPTDTQGIYVKSQVGAVGIAAQGWQACNGDGDIRLYTQSTFTSFKATLAAVQVTP